MIQHATRTTPSPLVSRLTCHQPRTTTHRNGELCGRFIAYVPGRVRFIGLSGKAPIEPDGRVWVMCRHDRVWNIFEVLAPE